MKEKHYQLTYYMKKLSFAFLAMVTLLVSIQKTHAQQGRNEEILKAVTDYFFLERENIHVHFDKDAFMTNESIWFKGYVFHRKKNVPFYTTVNIYANLIDSEGKILETKLVYGNIGSFSGSFKLNDTFKSGKYYLQFYTNWMNNFTEDESAVYEISVINQKMGAGNALAKADPSKITIDLNPEGGNIVNGIPNTIGIHIADANNDPMDISSVDIADASGKVLKKVQINKLGYGKFDLPDGNTNGYKVIAAVDDKKHEKALPNAQFTGIAIEVNNYTIADKTIIKIRTNKTTAESFGTQPLYLLVHRDEKANVLEVALNAKNLEQTIVIPNTDIADGMNTIRILDSNLKQLAERLFFKSPKPGVTAELSKGSTTKDDRQEYKGKVSHPNMNLSISILPENSLSFDETNDIYGSLLLLPYLDFQKKASGRHYFNSLSKGKLYELDLFLLNQKNKYQWVNIVHNPPKSNYPFDMGVTLKGTIPSNIDSKASRVRLYSLTSGIDEITEVNEKREFYFNNLVIPDSTYVNFTLLKRGAQPKEITLAPQVLNVNTKFNKPYKPAPHYYATISPGIDNPNIYKEYTQMEEVKIEGSTLKYANTFGNSDLRGYKISDSQASMYQNLVNFIKTYGSFDVEDQDGILKIFSRTVTTMNGAQSSPIIYIDNVQLLDLSMLQLIWMSEVDEIYMSGHKIVPSVRNYIGMIKIYLKKGASVRKTNTTPNILVKNAFEKVMPFENVTYNSTDDKGFQNFGIIDWQPSIMTNENGEFKLLIPKISKKPFKILIEGFSADGRLISEIKTVEP